jgi:hypothetical protein
MLRNDNLGLLSSFCYLILLLAVYTLATYAHSSETNLFKKYIATMSAPKKQKTGSYILHYVSIVLRPLLSLVRPALYIPPSMFFFFRNLLYIYLMVAMFCF